MARHICPYRCRVFTSRGQLLYSSEACRIPCHDSKLTLLCFLAGMDPLKPALSVPAAELMHSSESMPNPTCHDAKMRCCVSTLGPLTTRIVRFRCRATVAAKHAEFHVATINTRVSTLGWILHRPHFRAIVQQRKRRRTPYATTLYIRCCVSTLGWTNTSEPGR